MPFTTAALYCLNLMTSGYGTWIYRFIRYSLSLIFLYSGSIKLLEPDVFAVLINAYGLVPEDWVMSIAVLLPALEIVVAVGLLFDIKGSLAVTAGLMIFFMMILGYGIQMGLDIDCGCFGPDDPEAEAFHGLRIAICRDAVIMVGIIYLYIWRWKGAEKPLPLLQAFNRFYKTKGDHYGENV